MLAQFLLFELFFSAPFLFATMEAFMLVVEELDKHFSGYNANRPPQASEGEHKAEVSAGRTEGR